MKRTLVFVLALVMLIGLLPMNILASENEVNPWNGRSAIFVGDSITAGTGTTKIYYEYLEEAFGFDSVTAMGVPGSCVSAASDYGQSNQPLINRYHDIPSADLIVIFMGTNDYGHETPLGSAEDTKDGTFYGALNTIIPALVSKHSSSKIVFVTPLHRYGFGTSKILGTQLTFDSVANGVGANMGHYVDALKTVCASNGVSVIDLYSEYTFDPADAKVRSTYMPDGLHPNAAGHEVIAGIMESHIRSFEPAEQVTVEMTEMIYGNRFAVGNNQTCRASSRVNYYLKAGTVITLKDSAAMQWACTKTSDETSSSNLGYFPDGGWSDKKNAVVESDGWVGFVFKYRDESRSFDLTRPLSDYIAIEALHAHTYKNGICTGCGDEDTDGLSLDGLNVLCLGDSITAGQGVTTATRWTNVLASKYGWTLTNKSQGGIPLASYYYTSNGQTDISIAKKAEILKTMTTKPDVIIVWGGHNDITHRASPLGTWEDNTTDSFKGALKYIAELADEYAPDAMLFVLTPLWDREEPHTLKVPANTSDINWMFVDAIYEGAEKYGWIPINMDLCGITPYTKTDFLFDNFHPNVAGTEKIVEYLSEELAGYGQRSRNETIIFNQSSVSVERGESTTLKAVLSPRSGNGSHGFTWSSSNPSIATVDANGKVVAITSGTAVVTATAANGISAGISVSVEREHSYESVVTASTCTEQGYTTYTCTVCGDSYVDSETPVTEHPYEEWYVRFPSTCTEMGLEMRQCSYCGHSERRDAGLADHTPGQAKKEYQVYADCETDGAYDMVVSCTVCDAELSSEHFIEPALGHRVENEQCTRCHRYITDAFFDKGICSEYGGVVWVLYHDGTLEISGAGIMIEDAICPHYDMVKKVVVREGVTNLGGCFRFGNLESVTLPTSVNTISMSSFTDCGKLKDIYYAGSPSRFKTISVEDYNENFTNAKVHYGMTDCEDGYHTDGQPVKEDEVTPTCTKNGSYRNVTYCTVCNVERWSETVTVPKAEHRPVVIPAREPVCTASGVTEGRKCGDCNLILVEQDIIPAKGHTYKFEVTQQPTCTSEGVQTYTCIHDSTHTYTISIPKVDHTSKEIPREAPTCTEDGLSEGVKCGVCNKVIVEQTVLPATGHDYISEVTLNASCEAEGVRTYTCKNDPAHTYTEAIPALGHIAMEVTATGSCTEDGYTAGEICRRCTAVLSGCEPVPAAGHKYTDWTLNHEATCTEEGAEQRMCVNCFRWEIRAIPPTGHKDRNENYICDICDAKLCTKHIEEVVKGYAATCTVDGKTDGIKCGKCSEVLKAQKVVPANGHSFSTGKCDVCGAADPDYVAPTVKPTPTVVPTAKPTPTVAPTAKPTPTVAPTAKPTPTVTPTVKPTPTVAPTAKPTPTVAPTPKPTPTVAPTAQPTPTVAPTAKPTPTVAPTAKPTPTVAPTAKPTPTVAPTAKPTPTVAPTVKPTPTVAPTAQPTPTVAPTVKPTPTVAPTAKPTPTVAPTAKPTPTVAPTAKPTPNVAPTAQPTPTVAPTAKPTPTVKPTPIPNPFKDVKNTDWYYEAVLWAVQNSVTGGTSVNTFSPEEPCTRAQIVTFIWAASGRPEPIATVNPFKDVKESDWYYTAVLWAVEQGITEGTSATTFSPEQHCTRAQVVTFLYAAAGKPSVSGINVFEDVDDTAWYTVPVIWAKENEVTDGVGVGKFGPDQTCTRGQIVLFLYKVMAIK